MQFQADAIATNNRFRPKTTLVKRDAVHVEFYELGVESRLQGRVIGAQCLSYLRLLFRGQQPLVEASDEAADGDEHEDTSVDAELDQDYYSEYFIFQLETNEEDADVVMRHLRRHAGSVPDAVASWRREQARAAQRAEAEAQKEARRAEADARRAAGNADGEARRAALPEQLQGRAAGQDLAPATRPRRAPKPIDRLIERQVGV